MKELNKAIIEALNELMAELYKEGMTLTEISIDGKPIKIEPADVQRSN